VDRVMRLGDERAFRRLHERHTPRLQRLAANLAAGSSATPEDLVQETWIRAVSRLGRFEWRSSLSTWLTGILVNLFRESLRSDRRMKWTDLDEEAIEWPAAPGADARLDLARAVERLAPGARAVLLLHDVEGYTHQEIGEFLAISPGTSKSQLCRARRAVIQFLNAGRKEPYVRT
jgi:RNA polymerase sigma-70 factor (ECF subfamily)